MSLTLFLSVYLRRLRGRRSDRKKRADRPRKLRLVTSSAVRLIWVGGKPALRFVNTERYERVRMNTLTEVSFSVINGKPVFRFVGEDYTKRKRDNRKQHYDDVTGRVRLTSANSLKLYATNGRNHVSFLNN